MTYEHELRERVRAACCEFHGLGKHGLEQHIDGVVEIVQLARARKARALEEATRRELQREHEQRVASGYVTSPAKSANGRRQT